MLWYQALSSLYLILVSLRVIAYHTKFILCLSSWLLNNNTSVKIIISKLVFIPINSRIFYDASSWLLPSNIS